MPETTFKERMQAVYAARDAPDACPTCWGSGKLANDDDASPWPLWDSLEGVERTAITFGIVQPVPCPECGGSGKTGATALAAETNPSEEERLTVLGQRLAAFVQVALTIPVADVKLALEREYQNDTVGPILDPTRWRAERQGRAKIQRVLAAFLPFRQVLEEEQAKE